MWLLTHRKLRGLGKPETFAFLGFRNKAAVAGLE
jgi:hypothetical protein